MNKNVSCVLLALTLGFAATALPNRTRRAAPTRPLPRAHARLLHRGLQVGTFEAYDFRLPKGQKNRQEGKFAFVTYALERGKPEPSAVAILRNYENALTKIGGTVAATLANNWVNGSVTLDGREVWAEVERGNGRIWIRTIEKGAMKQHVVADAAAMSTTSRPPATSPSMASSSTRARRW